MILNVFLLGALSVVTMTLPPPPKTIFTFYQQQHFNNNNTETIAPLEGSSMVAHHQGRQKSVTLEYEWKQSLRKSLPLGVVMEESDDSPDEESTAVESHDDADSRHPYFPQSLMQQQKQQQQPMGPSVLPSSGIPTETITIQVVFEKGAKRTTKEVLHVDGSKTITTTVEEMNEIGEGNNEDSTAISDVEEESSFNDIDLSDEIRSDTTNNGTLSVPVGSVLMDCPDSPVHSIASSLSSGVDGRRLAAGDGEFT
jgi:hypothetical protein